MAKKCFLVSAFQRFLFFKFFPKAFLKIGFLRKRRGNKASAPATSDTPTMQHRLLISPTTARCNDTVIHISLNKHNTLCKIK